MSRAPLSLSSSLQSPWRCLVSHRSRWNTPCDWLEVSRRPRTTTARRTRSTVTWVSTGPPTHSMYGHRMVGWRRRLFSSLAPPPSLGGAVGCRCLSAFSFSPALFASLCDPSTGTAAPSPDGAPSPSPACPSPIPSSSSSSPVAYTPPFFSPVLLPSRALLRLTGEEEEVLSFLQGLVTCDIRRLSSSTATRSVWGCFLKLNGRVLADAYFYTPKAPRSVASNASETPQERLPCSPSEPHASASPSSGGVTVWVEVEKGTHATIVLEHLLEMKMRRKIAIQDVSDTISVVAEYRMGKVRGKDPDDALPPTSTVREEGTERSPTEKEEVETPYLLPHAVGAFEDPRSACLFSSSSGSSSASPVVYRPALLKHFIPHAWCPHRTATDAYQFLLTAYGIGEGAAVFVPHKSLPFDGNADLLADGISFQKGCYIGQELTHRTHVMLVVRKRLLPLRWRPMGPTSGEERENDAKQREEEDRKADTASRRPNLPVTSSPLPIRFAGQALLSNGKSSGKVFGIPLRPHRPVPDASHHSGAITNVEGEESQKIIPEQKKTVKDDDEADRCYYGLGVVRMEHVDPITHHAVSMTFEDGTPVYGSIPTWWSRKEVKKMFRKLKKG